MNFTVQDGSCSVAPREIIIQDSGDLKNWSGCHDRLIILRTVKGSGLTPIFDKLDTYDRSRAYKGVLPPGFRRFRSSAVRRSSIVPIRWTASFAGCHPFADHRPAERAPYCVLACADQK